jgi:GMP synthase (glutamine-hydrolysing)
MRVLAFRHAEEEDLGSIRPILEARGVEVECVDLYAGAPLPDVSRAAGLIFMGGAMCANDGVEFLCRELELIGDAARRGQPVFGVCLGAQLIAKALGGKVYASAMQEIGWSSIQLTESASSDPLFSRLASTVEVFQLHRDTFDLPAGSVWLARSEACPHQAFRAGENIYGVQFHPEMTPQMCREWRDVLGVPDWHTPDGAYPALAATCETLMEGWRDLLGNGR